MYLEVKGLNVWYGPRHVLRDLSVTIDIGFTVMVGRNGSGKSTLLKALYGLVPVHSGQALLDGKQFLGSGPGRLRAMGISYMPQGGQVFPDMSVRENLLAAALTMHRNGHHCRAVLELDEHFPLLATKMGQKAGTLSGGERQLLSLWMALLPHPQLLLLDEPLAGLSDEGIASWLETVSCLQTKEDVSIIIVEQRSQHLCDLATSWIELDNGRTTLTQCEPMV